MVYKEGTYNLCRQISEINIKQTKWSREMSGELIDRALRSYDDFLKNNPNAECQTFGIRVESVKDGGGVVPFTVEELEAYRVERAAGEISEDQHILDWENEGGK